MRAWQVFWSLGLLIAGASFALITLVVAMKGCKDLRDLFRRLHDQQDGNQ